MLERCGLISRTRRAQFRPCHLEAEPLDAAVSWIDENRRIWTERFDRLDAHLRDIQRTPPRRQGGDVDERHEADELTYTRVFDRPEGARVSLHDRAGAPHPLLGPDRVSTPSENIKVDARPGGVFETVMVNDADGSALPDAGRTLEIVEPERIAWTDPDSGMTTTSTFVDLGGGADRGPASTRPTCPRPCRGAEAQAGFSTSLDRFAAYLGTLSAEGDQA